MSRLPVLDALRCLFAFIVVFGHTGPPPVPGVAPPAVLSLMHTAGPVTGFFIVSGFCIHFAFADRGLAPFPVKRFYARRYIRIVVPVVGVLVLLKLVDHDAEIFGRTSVLWYSALWSVACEEIYYAFYPLINRARFRWGWAMLLVPSLLFSVALAAFTWRFTNSFAGIVETTFILFPIWLLGCVLAELFSESSTAAPGWARTIERLLGTAYTSRQIWTLRVLAFATNFVQGLLFHFTSFLSAQTFLVTGLILVVWIRAELIWSQTHAPNRWLVKGGLWSYSLYLVHPVMLWAAFGIDAFKHPTTWFVGVAAIVAASYAFYLTVERPAHRTARRIHLFQDPREEPIPPESEAVPEPEAPSGGHV